MLRTAHWSSPLASTPVLVFGLALALTVELKPVEVPALAAFTGPTEPSWTTVALGGFDIEEAAAWYCGSVADPSDLYSLCHFSHNSTNRVADAESLRSIDNSSHPTLAMFWDSTINPNWLRVDDDDCKSIFVYS